MRSNQASPRPCAGVHRAASPAKRSSSYRANLRGGCRDKPGMTANYYCPSDGVWNRQTYRQPTSSFIDWINAISTRYSHDPEDRSLPVPRRRDLWPDRPVAALFPLASGRRACRGARPSRILLRIHWRGGGVAAGLLDDRRRSGPLSRVHAARRRRQVRFLDPDIFVVVEWTHADLHLCGDERRSPPGDRLLRRLAGAQGTRLTGIIGALHPRAYT